MASCSSLSPRVTGLSAFHRPLEVHDLLLEGGAVELHCLHRLRELSELGHSRGRVGFEGLEALGVYLNLFEASVEDVDLESRLLVEHGRVCLHSFLLRPQLVDESAAMVFNTKKRMALLVLSFTELVLCLGEFCAEVFLVNPLTHTARRAGRVGRNRSHALLPRGNGIVRSEYWAFARQPRWR